MKKIVNISGNLTNVSRKKEYGVIGESGESYTIRNDMGSQMAYKKEFFKEVEVAPEVEVVEEINELNTTSDVADSITPKPTKSSKSNKNKKNR